MLTKKIMIVTYILIILITIVVSFYIPQSLVVDENLLVVISTGVAMISAYVVYRNILKHKTINKIQTFFASLLFSLPIYGFVLIIGHGIFFYLVKVNRVNKVSYFNAKIKMQKDCIDISKKSKVLVCFKNTDIGGEMSYNAIVFPMYFSFSIKQSPNVYLLSKHLD